MFSAGSFLPGADKNRQRLASSAHCKTLQSKMTQLCNPRRYIRKLVVGGEKPAQLRVSEIFLKDIDKKAQQKTGNFRISFL
jgi:hypothetical protein